MKRLCCDTGRYRAALAAKKKREQFQVSLGCVPVVCVSVFVCVCLCICLSLCVHENMYLCTHCLLCATNCSCAPQSVTITCMPPFTTLLCVELNFFQSLSSFQYLTLYQHLCTCVDIAFCQPRLACSYVQSHLVCAV